MTVDEIIPKFLDAHSIALEKEKKVKQLYAEFCALWREAPRGKDTIWDKEIWEQYHSLIEELIRTTDNQDYSKYRVKLNNDNVGFEYLENIQYRQN